MTSQTHPATSGLGPVARTRETSREDLRVPGFLFFLLSAGFMTVIMLAASIVPGYDYNAAAISDLGVIAETALLFNASLVAIGLLNVVGGYLFFRSHRKLWLLAVYLIAGVGAVGAGVFPLTNGLHSLFAIVAFLFFNLEAIGTGTITPGPMRAVSMLAGVIGIVFLVIMAIGDSGNTAVFGPIGHGGTERMIVYPVMLWMLAFGGYLMAAAPAEDR
jgi:hypothetical membrane protein